WQSSPDSITWTNLSGGTIATYNVSPTGTYYYHCNVTCTASSTTVASAAAQIGYEPSCPCTPSYNQPNPGNTNAMTSFSLTGFSTLTDNYGTNPSGYIDRSFSVSPVSLYPGATYSWTVTLLSS